MNLIVITTGEFFPKEADLLNQMFDAGLERLHVRKPGCSPEELTQFLKTIKPYYLRKIILHQHFEVLSDMNFGGIHLREEVHQKLSPLQVMDYSKKLKRFEKTISASFHNWKDVKEKSGVYDYVFISPVFDSVSKPGYKANSEVLTIPQGIKTKVVALGGITEPKIPVLKEAGFAGAAVLGGLWTRPQPEILPVFKKMQMLCKQELKR